MNASRNAPPRDGSAPPSRELLLLEARAIAELSAFFAMAPLLRSAPRGDSHPVLVLPGLSASDASTRPLRAFLRDRGYRAHGWKLGPNFGPRPGVEERMQERLAELHARYGRTVSLIGWSLGGIFAREMARRAPSQVRGVITLGSPFAGAPRASNAWQLYEAVSGRSVEDWADRERMKEPPPVPATAIFSRSDGIVAWQGCLERPGRAAENIEVEGSHCGLGHNPVVLYAIADRLAQPEGEWRPFERNGLRGLVYPDPYRDTELRAAA
ncbi:esterase/lipase family protein [Variovorax sp. JS1663]|uniref:esterase/lipase family protein n=1 Tax=Variovorax sp. JS1663 TaxID=1851577 RepID=UPI000B3488C3|nr:alpha/beta hydrolase [Variovorax sp. JS1663]OUM02600.1 alpha/beta hydrolase [Variovorax sp. JS1663]